MVMLELRGLEVEGSFSWKNDRIKRTHIVPLGWHSRPSATFDIASSLSSAVNKAFRPSSDYEVGLGVRI